MNDYEIWSFQQSAEVLLELYEFLRNQAFIGTSTVLLVFFLQMLFVR